MRIWIRFSRHGIHAKYVSHLDMQRLFARAFRRAGLPVVYSQGFNPHINMSFASALPVGMETDGDYIEVSVTCFAGENEVVSSLNQALPKGIRVLGAGRLEDKAPKLMAAVACAGYRVTANEDSLGTLDRIFAEKTVLTEKKTKGGIKTIDIRPMILDYKKTENGAEMKLMLSGAGSLSPAVLSAAAKAFSGEFSAEFVRTELYAEKQGVYVPLSE